MSECIEKELDKNSIEVEKRRQDQEYLIDALNQLEQIQTDIEILSIKKDDLMYQISKFFEVEQGKEKSFKVLGFKIKVKKPLNFKFDKEVWQNIRTRLAPELRPVKTEIKLDEKAYKGLFLTNKEAYEIASEAVTVSNGKVNVKVVERVVD